ncbi:hypothetical protein SRHO_G00181080 [Serrasalmus rhombeus]
MTPTVMVQPAVVQPAMVQPIPQPIIQQTPGPVVIRPPLKDRPGRMKCTCCHQEMVTVTRGVNGVLTWTIFGTLLVCGLRITLKGESSSLLQYRCTRISVD